MSEPHTQFADLLVRRKKVAEACSHLLPGAPKAMNLPDLSAHMGDQAHPEVFFLRSVLFVHSDLSGSEASFRFLLNNPPLDPEARGKCVAVIDTISALHAYALNSIDLGDLNGQTNLERSVTWFREQLGNSSPRTEEDWLKACDGLANEYSFLVGVLGQQVSAIESHPQQEQYLDRWLNAVLRSPRPDLIVPAIEEIARRIGFTAQSAAEFYQSHHDEIAERLETLGPASTTSDGRERVIEAIFLARQMEELPVTTKELMSHFNLKPGHEVLSLLMEASLESAAGDLSKEDLLLLLDSRRSTHATNAQATWRFQELSDRISEEIKSREIANNAIEQAVPEVAENLETWLDLRDELKGVLSLTGPEFLVGLQALEEKVEEHSGS